MNANLDIVDSFAGQKGAANGLATLGADGKISSSQLPTGLGTGTVTSVALSVPAFLTVSGSPITVSGTLAVSLASQTANTFMGAPNGSSGLPTFRAIVPADLPVMVASGASHAAGIVPDPGVTAGTVKFLREDATWQVPPGVGTVTSVALTMPSILSVAGSPVTSSGTLAVTLASQTAATVFAAPNGTSGTPTFRALVATDYPVFVASGASHAQGAVPDPGASAGTTRFLREDATWVAPGGSGTVTSVALTVPSWLTVAGSPITTTGTLAVTATGAQTANQFLATPNGAPGAVGLRAIVGADLPNPSATTLGGIQSLAAVTSKWINTISTSGVPSATQPAFTDISGTAVAGQIPNLDTSKITTGLLALARGGTNADLSATGGANQFLKQVTTGAAVTVGTIVAADVPSLDASKITTGQIALARGGTNADLSATGGASQVLKQVSTGAAITVGQLAFTDISGTAVAGQIPNLDASKITTGILTLARGGTGGDFSGTGGAGQYVKQLSTGAVFSVGTIASADIIAGLDTGAPVATNNVLVTDNTSPIALVQSTSVGAPTTGATSFSLAFGSNNTVGNCIIVAVNTSFSTGTPVPTISDSNGNTYTLVNNIDPLTTAYHLRVFYAKNGAAGANTVTATYTGGTITSGSTVMLIHEFSGLDTAAPFDVTLGNAGNNTTPTANNTPNNGDSFLFAFAQGDSAIGVTSPATQIVTANGGVAVTAYQLNTDTRKTSLQTINFSMTTGHWGVCGGIFKAKPAVVSFRPITSQDIAGLVTIPVFGASGGSHSSGLVPDPGGSAGTTHFLREDSTWALPPGSGTVTSVALSDSSGLFTISGSPVTTTGTLTTSYATQIATKALLGPISGANAAPTFRSILNTDLVNAVFGASGTGHSAGAVPDPGATTGATKFLREDGTWVTPSGSGTVTSVDMTVPAEFSVSGNPITTTGTLAVTKATQTANTVWAGATSGGAAAPTFRALVAADIPNLDASKITSGIIPTTQGGTGANLTIADSTNQVLVSQNASSRAFVQSQTGLWASGSTFTITSFGANLTTGNLILVAVEYQRSAGTASISVADNLGNTYTAATNLNGIVGAQADAMQIYYAKNITGGAATITVTLGGTVGPVGKAIAVEFSGIDTVNPIDQATGTTGSTTTNITVGASSTDGDVVVFTAGSWTNGSSVSVTTDANYTVLQNTGAGVSGFFSLYRLPTPTYAAFGTHNPSSTASANVSGFIAQSVVLKSVASISFRALTPQDLTPAVFVASGASHTAGAVPDPGATAGTLRFLREDATWASAGWDELGSTFLLSNAASSSSVTIAARDILLILVRVVGYTGSDIAALRFNGDTGTNYWDRHITIATNSTTLTNIQNQSTTMIRLAGATSTLSRCVAVEINNLLGTSKVCNIRVQTGSGAAGTIPILDFGGGEWVNTSAQITSVQLVVNGANSLLANTGFVVFGRNF